MRTQSSTLLPRRDTHFSAKSSCNSLKNVWLILEQDFSHNYYALDAWATKIILAGINNFLNSKLILRNPAILEKKMKK
jgi:hypothetical protein